MSAPVQFVIEGDKTYAIGSKGDRYEIRLESPTGGEAFCACEGFKWNNTDTRRDERPGRQIKYCRHLVAARERAMAAIVSPRFRLYHPASARVLADKFISVESLKNIIAPTAWDFPPHEMEIQKLDEAAQRWDFVQMAGDPPANVLKMPTPQRQSRKKEAPPPITEEGPKNREWYCRGCEQITAAIRWIDDKCPTCGDPYNMECDKRD